MCVHIDTTFYSGYTLAQHLDAARATLDEVLPVAEKLGVAIALENIFKPLNTVDDVLTLIKEFPSPCLGACFDSGHANIMEHGKNDPECIACDRFGKVGVPVPWEENVLDRMLPHIVNCHLHDNCAVRDDHDLPGRGSIDWKRVFARLRTAPRLKCMQSEVIAVKHAIPVRTLVETFETLRKN
jgi:sugar phosphate isomerase/epimerase